MTRKFWIAVCLWIAIMLLAACDGTADPTQPVPSGPVDHIVVTCPVAFNAEIKGLPEVQAAINAITIPELGVEVELLVVDATQTPTLYPNSITLGKQIDLMVLNGENIENYINKDMILPLEALVERYGQGIQGIHDTYMSIFDGTTFNGHTYGIGVPSESVGHCGGLWLNRALLEQVSFHYEPDKIYSLQELDVLFARIKAAYPDSYPLGQITSTYSFSTASFFLGAFSDGLSGGDPGGLALGSTQIQNMYEMPQYQQLLQYMRKWYLAGYIYPDSAITSATGIGLYTSGIVKSVPLDGSPYLLSDELLGEGTVCLRLSPIRIQRQGSVGIFWTIPVTSKAPDAAMRFLNMMYTDERIVNLLQWGIRGRDYALESDGTFRPLDGALYTNSLGLFGDQRLCYEIDGAVRKAVRAAFSAKAVFLNPEYNDFRFDTSALSQELLQIEQVKKQYLKLLESGCVDLDTVYPEFIQALYDAGLQRLMDEKQRQFDAWLAQNN